MPGSKFIHSTMLFYNYIIKAKENLVKLFNITSDSPTMGRLNFAECLLEDTSHVY